MNNAFNIEQAEAEHSLSFQNITSHELHVAFKRIKSNAAGHDSLSLAFIKKLFPAIAEHILEIINFMLTSSSFPDSWKIAKITPIPKVSSPNALSDFRPISILPILSKLAEIIIQNQIFAFINVHAPLNQNQSGFRAGHSTETAMIKITEDIRSNLISANSGLLVLLDFSKAFDLVNHDLLCDKLFKNFKFSHGAIRLIRNFLTDRSQKVAFSSDESLLKHIQCGVPQGSVLSPLLFAIFIDDLPKSLDSKINYHMYADDVQLYLTGPTLQISDLSSLMNESIDSVSRWAAVNGMKLNASKTQVMLINRNPANIELPTLFLNNEELSRVEKVKDLGLILDEKLSFNNHANLLCQKIFLTLRTLRLFQKCTPPNIKKLLVRALIIPIFTYCSSVYFCLSSFSKRKLQVAFNNCTRYVLNLRARDHISQHSKYLLGATFESYMNFRLTTLIYKLRSRRPRYLENLLTDSPSSRLMNLVVPVHNNNFQTKSLTVRAAKLWNSLPTILKNTTGVSRFTSSCFKYYAQLDF